MLLDKKVLHSFKNAVPVVAPDQYVRRVISRYSDVCQQTELRIVMNMIIINAGGFSSIRCFEIVNQ